MAERKVLAEFELSDGRRVRVFEGKARDLVEAQRMSRTPEEMPFGLLARLVEVDGKRLPAEDWAEMDLKSYMEISQRVFPLWGLAPEIPEGLSWPSPELPAGATAN
ncbi:MAG: hypothetical protein DSZ24_01665 [Thermodesulfatator sp.]|nr:MAG: hypothetical protein DSZ24_01665 [Thermodesulfatator sp.]